MYLVVSTFVVLHLLMIEGVVDCLFGVPPSYVIGCGWEAGLGLVVVEDTVSVLATLRPQGEKIGAGRVKKGLPPGSPCPPQGGGDSVQAAAPRAGISMQPFRGAFLSPGNFNPHKLLNQHTHRRHNPNPRTYPCPGLRLHGKQTCQHPPSRLQT